MQQQSYRIRYRFRSAKAAKLPYFSGSHEEAPVAQLDRASDYGERDCLGRNSATTDLRAYLVYGKGGIPASIRADISRLASAWPLSRPTPTPKQKMPIATIMTRTIFTRFWRLSCSLCGYSQKWIIADYSMLVFLNCKARLRARLLRCSTWLSAQSRRPRIGNRPCVPE